MKLMRHDSFFLGYVCISRQRHSTTQNVFSLLVLFLQRLKEDIISAAKMRSSAKSKYYVFIRHTHTHKRKKERGVNREALTFVEIIISKKQFVNKTSLLSDHFVS